MFVYGAYLRDVAVMTFGLAAIWLVGLSASLSVDPGARAAPVVLVSALSPDRIDTILEDLGGRAVGPSSAAFGYLAYFPNGTPRDALRDSGIWAVWDGRAIAALCGVKL